MHKTLLLAVPAMFLSVYCSAQQFEWAGQVGGNGWDAANKLAQDSSDAIYSVGTFNNAGDFDPGAGTFNMTSAGNQDIFLVKLTAGGAFRWARRFGGTSTDFGDAIAATNTSDVYIGGKFAGTADFDPGAGTVNLVSLGGEDAYVCKLDSSGNLLWAVSAGSTGGDHVSALATDANGNVYAIGLFYGTVDFDPGPGVTSLTATSGDLFIWKLDAAGNFVWAQRYGSSPGEYPGDICIDGSGNILVSGSFYGTVDFDPGAGTYNMAAGNLYDDAFLLKLDASGNFVWAKKFGGSSGNDVAYGLDVDATGYPHITGSFNAAGDYDPGISTYTLTPLGSEDVFIVKLTPSGDFIWAKQVGDANFQVAYDMTLHPSGDVYVTGMFDGTVDFDPGAGSTVISSAGSGDIFILHLDSAGNFRWAGGIGDNQTDFGMGIMALNGKLVVSGGFTQTADFDPGAGTYNMSSVLNTQDGFLLNICSSYNITVATAICSGDSLYAGGDWQTITGVYVDSFLSVYGCDSIVTTALTINAPVVALGNDTSFCSGDSLVLDAQNPGATYQWNTGSNSQFIVADSTGIYTVSILDPAGCDAADTISVTVHALPAVTFAPLGVDTFCVNSSVFTLTGGSPLGGTYSGTGVSAGQFDPAAAGAGLHTLMYSYTDSNGCTAADFQTVYVDVCAGVNIASADGLSVYPNPVTDYITINVNTPDQPVFILTNVTGQVMAITPRKTNQGTYAIDMQERAAGIYFLSVISGEVVTTVKLAKE